MFFTQRRGTVVCLVENTSRIQPQKSLNHILFRYKFVHAACKEFIVQSGHILEVLGKKKKAPLSLKKADELRAQEKFAAATKAGVINRAAHGPQQVLDAPLQSSQERQTAQQRLLRDTMDQIREQEQNNTGTNQLASQRNTLANAAVAGNSPLPSPDEDVDVDI